MDYIDRLICVVDGMLDTKRKRHIMGGALISASLFFGGLAITVMTMSKDC